MIPSFAMNKTTRTWTSLSDDHEGGRSDHISRSIQTITQDFWAFCVVQNRISPSRRLVKSNGRRGHSATISFFRLWFPQKEELALVKQIGGVWASRFRLVSGS